MTISPTEGYNDGYHRWWEIIEIHSNFFLTFPRDRLPAISGIARHFCTKRERQAGDYLAGFWRPDLPHCLYWSCSEYRPKSGHYVAPSWSWASIGAPVQYNQSIGLRSLTSLVDIIDISITPRRGDTFGEILSGYIRLHCRLCKFIRQPNAQSLNIVISDGGTLQLGLDKHVKLHWDFEVPETGAFRADEFWLPLPDGRFHLSDDVFYLMPLEIKAMNFSHQEVHGLILHRTLQQGQYLRVGAFQYWKMNDEPEHTHQGMNVQAVHEEISEALLGKLQVLDAENSLQEIVDGKCLIEIV